LATDYFSGILDDEERKKQEGVVSSQQPQGAQESAIVQGAQEPTQPGQGTKSGSFTNLQSYLDANESSKFGKQLAGQVESEADQASGYQNTAENQFKQRADSSAVGVNQNVLSRLSSDPVSLAKDAAAKSDFVKMRDAKYGGPVNFSDANDLYSETNQKTERAKNSADLVTNESGRKTLLDSYYGSGAGKFDYTSGQKKLDNYLVQVDPNSREYFKDAKQKADAVGSRFSNLTNTLNQYGNTKAQETARARQTARGAIGLADDNSESGSGALGMTKQQIQAAYEAAQKNYNDVSTRAKTQLANKDIDADLASRFGLQEGMDIWGLNPSEYYSQGNAPTLAAATSKDQAAKIAALYDLAGKDNTFLDVNQAGTYDPNTAAQFNKDGFLNDIADKSSLYNEAVNRKAFGMTGSNTSQAPGVGPGRFGGGGDASFGGSISGLNQDQVKQYFDVDGLAVDSGQVSGSIMDNLNDLNARISQQGNDPRFWGNERATYVARRDQFQNLLNALQGKYGYGDKLR